MAEAKEKTESGPTPDEKIAALQDAVGSLSSRLDKLLSAAEKADAKKDDKKKDAKKSDDDDDGEGDDKEKKADDEEGDASAAPLANASGAAAADVKKDRKDWQVRADRDNHLAELQQAWDQVAQFHGERATHPLPGESPGSYDRRHARRFQGYSPTWAQVDLAKMDPRALEPISIQIRADATAAAKQNLTTTGGQLREGAPAGPFRQVAERVRRSSFSLPRSV